MMYLKRSKCTFCTACINICPKQCIVIEKDSEGFDYPKIDKSNCIQCNLCKEVCHIVNDIKIITKTKAYAVKNKNEKIRLESTSGGFFSLIANYVLEKKGYVVGAAYDENFIVKHIIINEKAELYKLRGAKYSQSKLGNIFLIIKKLLDDNKLVLFSGTPCQCSGLKFFLRKEYSNLITSDLICHGVPSPKAWGEYINYRHLKEKNPSKLMKINMRCKDSGWTNYKYSTEFIYENKEKTLIPNSKDLFLKAFVGNICLRKSCSECKFKGLERNTDFTLGDFWGIWNQYPEFDDNKGISVVLTHSKTGESILKILRHKIELIEVNPQDVYKENKSLMFPSVSHPMRNEFLCKINSTNYEQLISHYFENESNQLTIKKIIKKLKYSVADKISRMIKNN